MSSFDRSYDSLEVNYRALDLTRRALRLRSMGNSANAINMLTEALQLKRQALPGTEYDILDELGYTHLLSGSIDKAVTQFQLAIELIEKNYYPDHFKVAPVLDHWAMALISVGQLDKAEVLVKKSLSVKQKSLLPNDVDVVETSRTLADIQRRLGKFGEAETQLRQAYRFVADATIGPTEEFDYEFALLNHEQGKLEAAEEYYQAAIRTFAHRGGKNHRLASVLRSYAKLLDETHRRESAANLSAEADAILSESPSLSRQDIPGAVFFDRDLYAATIMH